MQSAHQRLKTARITAGYSSAGDFAKAHNFPVVTYRAHESGARNFKVPSAQAYAAALGLSHPSGWRWLLLGEEQDRVLAGTPRPARSAGSHPALNDDVDSYLPDNASAPPRWIYPPSPAESSIVSVPLYDVQASAGSGAIVFDQPPTDYLAFTPEILATFSQSNPDKLAGISVRGDSMEPTLNNGDSILVDLAITTPTSDGIYVLRIDQLLLVKRISLDPIRRRVSVISDNSLYPPIEELELDQLDFVGKVIWLGRRL